MICMICGMYVIHPYICGLCGRITCDSCMTKGQICKECIKTGKKFK